MRLELKYIISLVKRLGALLFIYTCFRFAFIFRYYPELLDKNVIELLPYFYYGVIFDVSALFYINAFVIVLSVLPIKYRDSNWYRSIVNWLFIVFNAIGISICSIDIAYYAFTAKRTTADILYLKDDILELLPQYFASFWYLFIIWFTLIFGLYFLVKKSNWKLQKNKWSRNNFVGQFIGMILVLFVLFSGMRGGFDLRPLTPVNALEYVNSKYACVITNTPFTFLHSFNYKVIEKKVYYSDDDLKDMGLLENHFKQDKIEKNIVLIILESFGSEYVGFYNSSSSLTPFIDDLFAKSTVYTNAFANSRTSIKSINAILTGTPELMNDPLIHSIYQHNKQHRIGELLENYETAFFHGAKNGSMSFDVLMKKLGVNHYYGLDEYTSEEGLDGAWGVYDEPYLKFFSSEMDHFNEPFFTTFFSLSSHHPFSIPEKYKDKFVGGNLEIHKTIEYTDFALKQFFDSIKDKKWYKNSLFIITADHTSISKDKKYRNDLGAYRIPLAFFDPNNEVGRFDSTIVQHLDVLPTILDLLGKGDSIQTFGRSLNDSLKNPVAIQFHHHTYQLIKDDYLLQIKEDKMIGLYNYKRDVLLKKNLMNEVDKVEKYGSLLKGFIQEYNNRMIDNRLTD